MPLVEIKNSEVLYVCKIPSSVINTLEYYVDDSRGSDYDVYLDHVLLGKISQRELEDFEFEFKVRLHEQ